MLRNYFVIALRNLIKNPLNSFIKISGLSVGVAGCLIIFLLARYEMGFDHFHKDGDRIYRIYSEFSGVFSAKNPGVSNAVPDAVRSEFTGVEMVAHFQLYSGKVELNEKGEKKHIPRQEDLVIAEPEYFKVFSFYEWVAGSPESLKQPFQVVLTQDKAIQYFGTAQPDKVLGQQITYNDSLDVTVAGIIKSVTEQTDLFFKDFISYSTIEKSWLKESFSTNWTDTNSNSQCFIKLSPGTDVNKISDQLPLLDKKYSAENEDASWKANYHIQSLGNLHYNTELGTFDGGSSAANLNTLRTLTIVAVLLLIIAAINFINLETAQSIRRAKEVGLRKVMGGTRANLIKHFLLESTVLTTISVALAVPLASAAFLFFNEFFPKNIVLKWTDPFTILFFLSIILVVSLLSGVYPAFVLSSYQPAEAFKSVSRSSQSGWLRKILTVFQFSFSQILIVGTLVVGFQISFMVNKDLGFARDAIITFQTPWWEDSKKVDLLQNELEKVTGIAMISRNDSPPARSGYSTSTFRYMKDSVEIPVNVHMRHGDTTYLSLYNLKIIAGQKLKAIDKSNEILVNRAFCTKLGIKDPNLLVGETVSVGKDRSYTIVGIMEDFHLQSLHHTIEPLFYQYRATGNGFSVKLAGNGKENQNVEQTLEQLSLAYKKIYPDETLDYSFVDDTINKFYESEKRIAKLSSIATGLTIFISCLGLLGLASFTATQRTKEIGIRKVLGATVNHIVYLLSKEFLILVLVAFVIAAPISWYASDFWLKDFAYRIPLGWSVFALAGGISVLIAFFTVSFKALKAALTNPVDSLRYE